MKRTISEEYKKGIQEFKEQIKQSEQENNALQKDLQKDTLALTPYYHIARSDIYLNQVSLHIAMNKLSEQHLHKKNDGNLNDARKAYYNALTEAEKALEIANKTFVENLESLNSNQEILERIPQMNPKRILNLMNKFTEKFSDITNAYGTNNKYTWTLLELQARHTIIYKNMIDWRKASVLDPRDPYFQEHTELQVRCKENIQSISNRLREKYLLSTKELTDMRAAITYQETLKKIASLLNLEHEVETAQKTIDSWTALLQREEQLKKQQKKK